MAMQAVATIIVAACCVFHLLLLACISEHNYVMSVNYMFSALMLLVGELEGHLACKIPAHISKG